MIAFLRRNWEYKLLSLVLSILLYFIASTQRNPSRTSSITVQAEVVGLPAELAVKTPPRPSQITLTGPEKELELVRKDGIRVTVSATGARPGKSFLPVTYALPREAQGPVAVDAPPTLEVELEARIERAVPVRVLFVNQPPAGFQYATPESTPAKILVTGLASEVNQVVRVVALLDNADSAEAILREVPVVAQDAKQQVLSRVTLQPEHVRVSLKLREAPATKTLVLSAKFTGTPAPGSHLTGYQFSPALIEVRGEPTQLNTLSAIAVPVALSGLARSERRKVILTLPPGISQVRAEQVQLTLTVDAPSPASPAPKPTGKP